MMGILLNFSYMCQKSPDNGHKYIFGKQKKIKSVQGTATLRKVVVCELAFFSFSFLRADTALYELPILCFLL
jgi:hypothetical protein